MSLTRRALLVGTAALAGSAVACARSRARGGGTLVNDVHAQLSPTRVDRVLQVGSAEAVQDAVRTAGRDGAAISIAGGRHAMGGQQFGAGTWLLDTRALARVLRFEPDAGLIEVEAGIQWPALIDHLLGSQRGRARPWGIVQKQTGADRLSIGGALAANIHGRGLRHRPIIQDVEAFVLVGPDGAARTCSRRENPELFRLAIGGYGLFGPITSVTLRLAPRQQLERVVQILEVDDLGAAFEARIAQGFRFGDFQYATDPGSEAFLRTGVLSCYRPVDPATPMPDLQRELSVEDWSRLLYLSHTDKRRAFEEYARYYLSTSGQLYWSDTQQLSLYIDDYHRTLDRQLGAGARGTEMITEIYVPRPALAAFLAGTREDFRAHGVDLVYGTVRLIERDDESFLAWAREAWACIIFNLHVVHTEAGLARAAADFQRLIDLALRHGGSYYLTYHRWATRRQVQACHPRFVAFLREKRRYDPSERFQSDWYRHYRRVFADSL